MPGRINITILLGFIVSGVTAVSAVIVLTGFLLPASMPMQFRIMFGIVLLLLGIYRFFVTLTQIKQKRLQDEEQ